MTDDIPDTGAVFTFGKSHFADNEPSHFFIKNDPIVAISCGDEHSAVICQNGRVFVFGGNAWGQLGLGNKDEVSRPSCVKWLKPHRALFVACGRAHTIFVTDTHAIYMVGCNEEGQLGTGDTESHTVPQYVELPAEDEQIKQVSAGSNHTVILTDSGRVFVCGSNTEGQLGLGEDTRTCLKFTELNFMEKIDFVECGYYHTVFITSKGAVFVTGDNEAQKLAISNTASNVYVPEVLPLETPVKGACCGANHTFLLSMDESKILAFGSNERGQLGLPQDVMNVTVPTGIDMDKMFDGYQLKLVACGAMHTAFVTDNGLLYTCGESRHNKLCLNEIEDANLNDGVTNQYLPKRVTAMNGFIVDNVACGGCHTLLTATKGSNADFSNNDFSIVNEQTSLTELPPLQKIPSALNKNTDVMPQLIDDMKNSNLEVTVNPDNLNGNPTAPEDNASIDSLEANVSGSHIVNINDLADSRGSTHDIPDLNHDNDTIEKAEVMEIIDSMDTLADNMIGKTKSVIDTAGKGITSIADKAKENIEAVEEAIIKKTESMDPGHNCSDHEHWQGLDVPKTIDEISNTPPPKTPILQDLLHVPDLTKISPDLSKISDDGQKSDTGSKSENETLPCESDKSSPQADKMAKTQAVLPIVRSEDLMDTSVDQALNEEGVVVNKLQEKGRFSRIFQSIRDKENSCMGKGKVIEETVEETVQKGLTSAEETVHKIEDTVETEIRNQTNSRTCTIL